MKSWVWWTVVGLCAMLTVIGMAALVNLKNLTPKEDCVQFRAYVESPYGFTLVGDQKLCGKGLAWGVVEGPSRYGERGVQ